MSAFGVCRLFLTEAVQKDHPLACVDIEQHPRYPVWEVGPNFMQPVSQSV